MDLDEDRLIIHKFLDEALKVKFRPGEVRPGEIADSYNGARRFFEQKMV